MVILIRVIVRPIEGTIPFVRTPEDNTAQAAQPPVPKIKVTLPGPDTQIMLVDTGAAFNHLSASIAAKHSKDDINKTSRFHTSLKL